MASFCNYTHPELQITENLTRQDTGTLFPYNPEFYDNATGLYGPGAIYCWYMLLASVLATWFNGHTDEKKPSLSSDLVGALAYPAFAATDLMIQSIRMIGISDRAVAIHCLAVSDTPPSSGNYSFSTEPLDMKEIPPEILDLGQRVIDILGPCKVSWTAGMFLFLLIVSFIRLNKVPAPKMRNMPPCYLMVFGTFGYMNLSLAVFYFSLGQPQVAYFLFMFEAYSQFFLMATWILIALEVLIIPASIVTFLSAWKNGKEATAAEALDAIKHAVILMIMFLVPFGWSILDLDLSNIPDLAIRITERDQLATLTVGIVTLIYTVLDLLDLIPVPAEVVIDEEAIEMLAPQDVEESDLTVHYARTSL